MSEKRRIICLSLVIAGNLTCSVLDLIFGLLTVFIFNWTVVAVCGWGLIEVLRRCRQDREAFRRLREDFKDRCKR